MDLEALLIGENVQTRNVFFYLFFLNKNRKGVGLK